MSDDHEFTAADLQEPPPLHATVTREGSWGPAAWQARISDNVERGSVFGWTRAHVERKADRRMAKIKRDAERRRATRTEREAP